MVSGPFSSADIKYKIIDESTAATNIIIALVANKLILVLELSLTCAGIAVVQWRSGFPSPTVNLTGPMPLAAAFQHYLPFHPNGHFVTAAAGQHVYLTSGAAVQQSGWIVYVGIPG